MASGFDSRFSVRSIRGTDRGYTAFHAPRYAHVLETLGRHGVHAGSRLLDLGSSWGRWSIAAARKGYSVVGLDPSLGAVLAARRGHEDNLRVGLWPQCRQRFALLDPDAGTDPAHAGLLLHRHRLCPDRSGPEKEKKMRQAILLCTATPASAGVKWRANQRSACRATASIASGSL